MKLISNYAVKLKQRTNFTTDIQSKVFLISEILHNILFEQKKLYFFDQKTFIRSNVFDLACVCCTHMLKHAHTGASSKRLKTKLKNSDRRTQNSSSLGNCGRHMGGMERWKRGGGILFLFLVKFFFLFSSTQQLLEMCCAARLGLGWETNF